jgi:hypothetical protein
MSRTITHKNRNVHQLTIEPISPPNLYYQIHEQSFENETLQDLNISNDRSNSEAMSLRPLLLRKYGSFMEDIRRRGGVLIGRYTNDFTQVRVQCDFKHIFDITPKQILQNNWCPICTEEEPFDLESIDLQPTYNGSSE